MDVDGTDPERPLREVFTEEQIEFLRENQDQYDLDSILDKTLKDLMTSDDDPSVADLMQSATGGQDAPEGPGFF